MNLEYGFIVIGVVGSVGGPNNDDVDRVCELYGAAIYVTGYKAPVLTLTLLTCAGPCSSIFSR